MMLGVSGLMAASGDGAAAAESGGASGGSSEVGASTSLPGGGVDEFERSGGGGGGNRWPRQETLALLKIRSDMDVAFRDSSLKGPLWDEVSRKLAELGFHRSAKKCKEKFENVFKYHKRTKDGRASKSDGKTYRFFDQLMALENAPSPPPPPPPRPQPPSSATSLPMPSHSHISITVPSASPTPLSSLPPIQTSNNPINSSPFQPPPLQPPPAASNPPPTHTFQPSHPHLAANSTSSSSTSSDEDIQRRRGKKRKWKDFFQRLMKDVIHKQEELQKKFLDTLEKRERDRMAREESWRVQEMARMNREHEFLVQERSIAAAKDAAVIAFLQKVTEQNNLQIPISSNIASPQVAMQPQQPPKNPQPPQQTPPPLPPLQLSALSSPVPPPPKAVAAQPVASETPEKTLDTTKTDNGGGDNSLPASSSRWPKSEVQALINLRTSLDLKYQENGPKGPLWEEISAAMAKLGYNRSSKRCKEKWENINKYFKKVKESSKKRPEDSKTCPYFHQLDAIYKERAKSDGGAAAAFNQGINRLYMLLPASVGIQSQSKHHDVVDDGYDGPPIFDEEVDIFCGGTHLLDDLRSMGGDCEMVL
ncbi:Duplicated homeodomain-like superfamily protein [Perilla frutescens var. hirtella]|uniref:Duplicated homeodomain-like superfamily protein n=1 Tax=Perilla frutescens var. hirtella TaxID=608512 RepID=A0AAD4JLF9_PERFH|nr:Duplicated homeodomain-like superfamily protein [Perilla frutescens var. hirtella]